MNRQIGRLAVVRVPASTADLKAWRLAMLARIGGVKSAKPGKLPGLRFPEILLSVD
jgi:hypothetical protein